MTDARSPLALIAGLPLVVSLTVTAALAMQIPAAQAAASGSWELARIFLWSGLALAVLASLLGLALAGHHVRGARGRGRLREQLAALVASCLGLPLLLALPFWLAVPGSDLGQVWFEMVSAFTTTGATLWSDPTLLSPTLHLWRATVGWMGGFFIWVAAAAIFQPLNLGGFEVLAETSGEGAHQLRQVTQGAGPAGRVPKAAGQLLPVWLGLTAALWLGLLLAGDPSLLALCHAMSTLSTSGISPLAGGLAEAPSGRTGEMLVLLFLVFALSRSTFTGRSPAAVLRDGELRLGLVIVLGASTVLFLRHWLGAFEDRSAGEGWQALQNLWGMLFSTASFLTTTGFVSVDWIDSPVWSGLATPGLILMGLAALGGGVATAAGGVKLLRVLALWQHGRHELERLVEPHAVSGAAAQARRIRGQGAQVAWLVFMLFALALAAVVLLLTALGQELQPALILATAALTTSGQVADVAGLAPLDWAALGPAPRMVLALAMVVGRVETLAVLALLSPGFWRR